MIVYGDAERFESADEVRVEVIRALESVGRHEAGIARHAALVDAFIRTSELVQGIADAEFDASGLDAPTPRQRQGAEILLMLALAIERSWRSSFGASPDLAPATKLLSRLDGGQAIRTRTCEGYAHYALYPEAYLEAARHSNLGPHTCVIGIRSIGIGLAALVAAALGAGPAVSLRPTGHPFRREIRASPNLIAASAADAFVAFAIVDEGPGLSGSSFAAVARWLLGQGIAKERIHLFPSHGGTPGNAAGPEILELWKTVRRHDASRHDVVLHRHSLSSWIDDLIGPAAGPLRELGEVCARNGIPHDTRFERRKFLVRAQEGDWLIKFAGLGEVGRRKLHDARLLAAAGFTPEIRGSRHGFMVQRWVTGRPPDVSDRPAFLQRLGSYLAFRARQLPAGDAGATLEALCRMAVQNASEALGDDAGAAMAKRLAGIARLQHRVRPVRIDGRLHAWEWIRTGGGDLLKIDAVDHCTAHDLVGCQDIAWDVAGAIVEHALSGAERDLLCRRVVENDAAGIDEELLEALIPCYLAFQLGLWSSATPPSEQGVALARGRARSYGESLRRMLVGH